MYLQSIYIQMKVYIQWKQFNVITLGQNKTDNITQKITKNFFFNTAAMYRNVKQKIPMIKYDHNM
jgi:hypothetical protein